MPSEELAHSGARVGCCRFGNATDRGLVRGKTGGVPLVAVTGAPGSGKSTVLARLRDLGRVAYGTDEDRLSGWRDRASKLPVPDPADWHDPIANGSIEYRVRRDRIEDIRNRADDQIVYVCGFAGDEAGCWDLLDLVVCLVVDTETLRHRLMTRDGNDYGKADHELQGILTANATWEESYRGFGATLVDATRPVDDVVTEILTIAEEPAQH